jgi:DNA-binding MarR family transcriptional regulator
MAMRDGIDEARLEAWLALMHAREAVTDAIEDDLVRERALPLAWHEVLVQLSRAPEGRMRMQELAHEVLLSKSGLSRLVDRMEAAGFVARESCASDRRGTFATLTDAGKDELRASAPVFAESFQRAVARHLDDDDVAALRAVLGKLLAAHDRTVGRAEDCVPGVAVEALTTSP